MSERPQQVELPEDFDGKRLDKALAQLLSVSRAEVQRLIADQRILCQGAPVERRTRLAPGSCVQINWLCSVGNIT